jgi:hypothetical protein
MYTSFSPQIFAMYNENYYIFHLCNYITYHRAKGPKILISTETDIFAITLERQERET